MHDELASASYERSLWHKSGMAVLACMGALVLAVSATASATGPAWRIDSVTNTAAEANSTIRYGVQVTNVGDAPTTGDPYTLQVTLPTGLTGVSVDTSHAPGIWDCSVAANSITCTNTTGDVLDPSMRDVLPVTASVDPDASGLLTSRFEFSGGGAGSASTVDPTTIAPTLPPFGLDAFDAQVTANPQGDSYTQAGGHPYAASTSIDFNTIQNPNPLIGALWPVEPAKDVVVDLPPGFIGNPTSTARCTLLELSNGSFDPRPLCPPASQVGTTLVRFNFFGLKFANGPIPVYSLVPPGDVPARFGFNVMGTIVTLNAEVRSNSDYGLRVNVTDVSEGVPLGGTTLTFWGTPADPSHDAERTCPNQHPPAEGGPSCAAGTAPKPFLRNPTACTPPGVGLPTTIQVDSWVHPGDFLTDSITSHQPPGYPYPRSEWGRPQGPTGCDEVPFEPEFSASPTGPARAGTPSAFTFDLTSPQVDEASSIGEGDMKRTVVTLPEGVRVSPSSADGLQGCSPAQMGLIGTGFPAPNPIHFSTADPACPDASKIGQLTIDTPLLDQPLTGSIYLATPNDNPFHSLISIYLVAKGSGVIVKIPGKVSIDQQTGQLTATFDNLPQTPFSRLHTQFDGGPRAPLVTPDKCGAYTTHAELTSWSGATVGSDSTFTVSADGSGAPCPPSGFAPGFSAGTLNPAGGKASPFLVRLTREDREQRLSELTVDTPTGLLGKIASTVLCSGAAANAGTCGDASRVGSVTVGAGAGPNPFYITSGRAYITGPYKGVPYGLSIVVPAVAGPFDLGNVVVRAAIGVDRHTAQLHVASDPLPTILQGIPLDLRDVRVTIDKPGFTINPTSCAPKRVLATAKSTLGAVAHLSQRFQAANCATLPLAPKLTLTVGARRHTRAGVSTPLTTILTQTPGQTNLRSVSVALPGTLNALLPVVNRACKLAEFEAGHCTSRAKVGTAVAVTPLLRDPLRGSVYFVKNPKRILPDLMVALRGQVALDLTGKISIPGGKRLATRFDTIPDAPITKFTLRIVSGKNGPVGIATNLCSRKGRSTPAAVGIRGQNNALTKFKQRLRIKGCPRRAR
jgi:hypothetical protein